MKRNSPLASKPETRYAKSGHINIAYQVFGEGPTDIIYIPGWISNIDLMWDCPELVHFLSKLADQHRVILFDKRGTGLSDRIVELSTIEERMDDIRAVMDAVQSDKAILFGHSEGGSVSALFAATYPNRTIALITFGVFAKRVHSTEYPWAPTVAERQKVYDMIENHWGSGDMGLEDLAPSKATDKKFMDWLARYFRSGASPSAALVLTKMNTQVDIIDILPSIKVPTLMMQRTHDIDVKIEEGRFIADRIEGARFVEFSGSDHLFWAGNTSEVLTEMEQFIAGLKPFSESQAQLLTLVYAKITHRITQENDQSFITLDLNKIEKYHIHKYRGHIAYMDDRTILAYFDGPSKAVHCFLDLQQSIKSARLNLKAGLHLGECYMDRGQLKDGHTLAKVKSICHLAAESEIVVSQSIKHLLPEAELAFSALSTDKNRQAFSPLFKVVDRFPDSNQGYGAYSLEQEEHGLLLERVLKVTYSNIDNEDYSVDRLCKEVGISERQLQRKIKAITNKSPNQLIRSVRLHRAKELLSRKSEGVSQIAFRTGFTDASYFSKCFKEEFGFSPSEMSA